MRFEASKLKNMPAAEAKKMVTNFTAWDLTYASNALRAGACVARIMGRHGLERKYLKRLELIEIWYAETAPHQIGEPCA